MVIFFRCYCGEYILFHRPCPIYQFKIKLSLDYGALFTLRKITPEIRGDKCEVALFAEKYHENIRRTIKWCDLYWSQLTAPTFLEHCTPQNIAKGVLHWLQGSMSNLNSTVVVYQVRLLSGIFCTTRWKRNTVNKMWIYWHIRICYGRSQQCLFEKSIIGGLCQTNNAS